MLANWQLNAKVLFACVVVMSALACPSAASDIVLAIDPGHPTHGGDEGNVPNNLPGCTEVGVNWNVATRLMYYYLDSDNWFNESFLTRLSEFQVMDLEDRVIAATNGGAMAFLSIHHNCCSTISEYTVAAYCNFGEQAIDGRWQISQSLATEVADEIHAGFTSGYNYINRSDDECLELIGGHYDVLEFNPIAPSILCEAAFIKKADGTVTDIGTDLCDVEGGAVDAEAYNFYYACRQWFVPFAIGTSFNAAPHLGDPENIVLTWQESDPPEFDLTYGIYRSDTCWGPWTEIAVVERWDTCCTQDAIHYQYVDNLAGAGMSYARPFHYKLIVFESGETVQDSATPISGTPTYPGVPGSLHAEVQSAGGVVSLDWGAASGTVAGYHVFRSVFAGWGCPSNAQFLGSTSSLEFEDANAPHSVPLQYKVIAYNGTSVSAPSNAAEVEVQVVGISEESDESAVTRLGVKWLGAGGASGELELQMPLRDHVTVRIYDVRGREVENLYAGIVEQGVHRLEWAGTKKDGSEVATGVYFARVSLNSGQRVSTKVVIVR